MKIYIRSIYFFVFLIVPFIIAGCASGTEIVRAIHTVGLVGQQPVKIYLVNITGTAAEAFRQELFEALSADKHFIVERYGIEPPPATDTTSVKPALLLTGKHETHQETQSVTETTDNQSKNYQEITDIDYFHYIVEDAMTGEELAAGVVNYQDVSKEEEQHHSFLESVFNSFVSVIWKAITKEEASRRKHTIHDFIASLKVHPEERSIEFFKDDDLSELKEGISVARNGRWDEAIKRFQAAVENHPKHKNVHKAYFDLGIAYEYHYEFAKALTSLNLANELFPLQIYKAEIETCQYYAWQQDWRESVSADTNQVNR